ncbi:DUF7109 family protein [Haloparvum sedimenti]|uniref:DUF7109 family protein n=1 Tax=Haloparvum sedimenti TaxID=1678448 RepID=UPI00071E76CA|nr:hypothetical protein [Haloparvum sedimenti]
MTDFGDPAEGPSAASIAARDEIAGVVDLFGALTRAELRKALSELAFKRGADVDEAAVDAAVDAAIREYALVPVDASPDGGGTVPAVSDDDLLAVGPAAFPTLPERAEDLPHILDVPDRDPDRAALGRAVASRLRAEADALLDASGSRGGDRAETLLDVCYDLDVWAPVETDDVRDRLTEALADAE